jgi:hypothetical protein
MTKRRSYGHRRLRAELREFINTERRTLLQPLLFVVVLVLLTGFAPDTVLPPTLRGFLLGSTASGYTAVFLFLFAAKTGSLPRALGVLAESFTYELFASSASVVSVIDNIEFDHSDVDLVAVTRAGVLAIETKWIGASRAGTASARDGERWVTGALRQTERSANKIRSLLRSKDFATDVPVLPVLVLWGPGAAGPRLESGGTRAGVVLVLRGPLAAAHLEQFGVGPVAQDLADEIAAKLHSFVRLRADYERSRSRRTRPKAAVRSAR